MEHSHAKFGHPRKTKPFVKLTTALLILTMLKDQDNRPITAYELGLWIKDLRNPPRPLSIVLKNLVDDGYIQKVAVKGLRNGLWALTNRGHQSLFAKPHAVSEARIWLKLNKNLCSNELCLIKQLQEGGHQTVSELASACGLRMSPVKTALKKMIMREYVAKYDTLKQTYFLTESGLIC